MHGTFGSSRVKFISIEYIRDNAVLLLQTLDELYSLTYASCCSPHVSITYIYINRFT